MIRVNVNDRASSATREIDTAAEFGADSISQCHQCRTSLLRSVTRARARAEDTHVEDTHAGARGM